MAKISTIKEALKICRAARITPFIWGHRGMGKSSSVLQYCAEDNMGFIDLRCSQLEASDIRGLPDRIDGRTAYLPPIDMPIGDLTNAEISKQLGNAPDPNDIEAVRLYDIKLKAMQPRFQHGILFIDEVNRAQDDVLQAIFQLVLDRSIGTYVLPPGWSVVAAGNYMEGYTVSGFTSDPAFVNRFCHLILSGGESTVEEWVDYMANVHGPFASDVIEFASQNVKHLDGEISGELGFSIQPSRRSWEMVVKVQQAFSTHTFSELAKTEVIAGLVGRELGLSFLRYSCPVKPRDIINKGVKYYQDLLPTLHRNQLTGLMWGLVSYCKSRIDDDEQIADVCMDFTEFLVTSESVKDKDLVVAFCKALVSGGQAMTEKEEKIKSAVISNPNLAAMMSKFSGKSGKKTFITKLAERPELHAVLSRVTWGPTESTAIDKTIPVKSKKK